MAEPFQWQAASPRFGQEVEQLFKLIDADGDGSLDYMELDIVMKTVQDSSLPWVFSSFLFFVGGGRFKANTRTLKALKSGFPERPSQRPQEAYPSRKHEPSQALVSGFAWSYWPAVGNAFGLGRAISDRQERKSKQNRVPWSILLGMLQQ